MQKTSNIGTLRGYINSTGDLEVNKPYLKQITRLFRDKHVQIDISVLDGRDGSQMVKYYKGYVIPKMQEAWKELGERFSDDYTDLMARKLTKVCHQNQGGERKLMEFEDLTYQDQTEFLDELKVFCLTNLNLVL
jgi:hypothetical protein